MPPKKESTGSSRKETQKKVAFERAAHFARSDQPSSKRLRSAASTTPTGVINSSCSQNDIESRDGNYWPGPFSTAKDMISKRDAAREAREMELSARQCGSVFRASKDMDEYDQMLLKAKEMGTKRVFHDGDEFPNQCSNVPSLQLQCIRIIADHIDDVESLGELSVEVKNSLIAELAARRRLSSTSLSLIINGRHIVNDENSFANPFGMPSLSIPDCSTLSDEDLVNMLGRKEGFVGGYGEGLKFLDLHNCGHCFSSWAAERLGKQPGVLASLEILKLGGLYRITDQDLANFLWSVGADRLLSLSLTHSLVVGQSTVQRIPQSFPCLLTLSLDYCALDTAALDALCYSFSLGSRQYLSRLTELSLCGIEGLTDEHVEKILSPASQPPSSSSSSSDVPLGVRLISLSLKQSHALTDASLTSIRTHCTALTHLDLSGLCFLTNDGMLELFQSVAAYYPPQPSDTEKSVSMGLVPVCPLGPLRTVLLNDLSARAISDSVVEAVCQLSEAAGGGLHELGISGAALVTSRSIMIIQKYCSSNLRKLDVSFVRKICADSLCSLIHNAPRLSSLFVWGCTQLQPDRVNRNRKCSNTKKTPKDVNSFRERIDGFRSHLHIVGFMDK